MEHRIIEYWWEGNDFYFRTDKNEVFCCKNAYVTDMTYEGLDCDETTTVQQSKRYHQSATSRSNQCHPDQ